MQLDSIQLQNYLPSRYPFLMVDCVESVEPGDFAIGYKNLSNNEWFFPEHNENGFSMPRTLILEALEEMLIIVVKTIPNHKELSTRFISATSDFGYDVYPGSKLVLEAKLESFRRGLLKGSAKALSQDNIVCEASLSILFPEIANNYIPIINNN